MVQEYTERFYLSAAARSRQLAAEGMERAKALAGWKAWVRENWGQVQIEAVEAASDDGLQVGDTLHLQASVRLGGLSPEDVSVEAYLGHVDVSGEILEGEATPLTPVGPNEDGSYLFEAGDIPCRESGLYGYNIRVLPHHPDLVTPFLPGLITWAGPDA
jgi:starch phosphorylase